MKKRKVMDLMSFEDSLGYFRGYDNGNTVGFVNEESFSVIVFYFASLFCLLCKSNVLDLF